MPGGRQAPGGAGPAASSATAAGAQAGLAERSLWTRGLWVAALVALDLVSKWAAFAWLEGDPGPAGLVHDAHGHARVPLAGDWLALMLSRNPGVAFGRLGDFPHLIVGGRIVAVLFLTWLVLRTRGNRLLATALVLVLAGALGNLHDNLFIEERDYAFGRVRDFIDVYFARWDYHFPTFNVADSCITVGAVFLFASSFFGESSAPEGADPDAPGAAL